MRIKTNLNNNNINKFLTQYSLLKDIDKSLFLNSKEIKVSLFDYLKVRKLIKKSDAGIDLTFIYGYRYFYKDKFKIKKGVFVPQPDTEGILELVNPELKRGLEVGVGAGVISTTLSKHFEKEMVGIDINKKAIELSGKNSADNSTHIELKLMDIFKYNPKIKFDFLISNPPYIEFDDPHVEEWVKNNQPFEALYADDKGLIFYKHLIKNSSRYVKDGGEFYFEFGWEQKPHIEKYLQELGKEYNFYKDLQGHWRFLKVVV